MHFCKIAQGHNEILFNCGNIINEPWLEACNVLLHFTNTIRLLPLARTSPLQSCFLISKVSLEGESKFEILKNPKKANK